ncbi:hypothetical protein AgCh_018639 [Apium graveolens]
MVYKLSQALYGLRQVPRAWYSKLRVDFKAIFAPVTRLEIVRLLLALSAKNGWMVHHLDVKSTFLNVDLKVEFYVSQSEGFEKPGQEHMVYKLSQAFYGLRQAPRVWYSKLMTGTSDKFIQDFKKQMEENFEMSDLGKLAYYLGIESFSGEANNYTPECSEEDNVKQKCVAFSSCETKFMAATTTPSAGSILKINILFLVRPTIHKPDIAVEVHGSNAKWSNRHPSIICASDPPIQQHYLQLWLNCVLHFVISAFNSPSVCLVEVEKSPNHVSSCAMLALPVTAPGVSVPTPQTKDRAKLKEMFEDAYERCRTNPLECVSFNVQDFHLAIQQYYFNSEIGTKLKDANVYLFSPRIFSSIEVSGRA